MNIGIVVCRFAVDSLIADPTIDGILLGVVNTRRFPKLGCYTMKKLKGLCFCGLSDVNVLLYRFDFGCVRVRVLIPTLYGTS